MQKHTAERKLQRGITNLLINSPFYGVILSHLDIKIVENAIMPDGTVLDTAVTDGIRMWIDRKFIESLSSGKVLTLLDHEVQHVARKHPIRCKHRDGLRWNIATDITVNISAVEANMEMIFERGQYPYDEKYKGWLEEKIYEDIPDSLVNKYKQNKLVVYVTPVNGLADDKDEKMSEDELSQFISDVINKADARCKTHGNTPGWAEDIVMETRKNKVPWHSRLYRNMTKYRRQDLSWKHIARKPFATGLYLPDDKSLCCGDLGFATDTSGSMSDTWVCQAIAEGQAVVDTFPGTNIHSLFFDAVLWHYGYGSKLDIPSKFCRGGTSFNVVFDYIKEHNLVMDALYIFTDLECTFPDEVPDIPVTWISPNKSVTPPFGELILIDMD